MTELELFLNKLTSIKDRIVASNYDDDEKLSTLRCALVDLLESSPDNIISDEKRDDKWEDWRNDNS